MNKAAARRLIGASHAEAPEWTRDAIEIDDGDDAWFMQEVDEDELERGPRGPPQPPAGQFFPAAAAAGSQLGARRRVPTTSARPTVAPAPASTSFPAAPGPGPHPTTPFTGRLGGIFELQTTLTPPDEFASIRSPTAAELSAVSTAAIRLLFSDRRFAEITRPRNATDNVKAAAALKARRSLLGEGIQPGQTDSEHHTVYYGFQAVFSIGHSAMAAGDLLTWSTPFGLDIPGDISKTTTWAAHLATAATLFPRLETAVFASRTPTREFPMPSSLFSQVRKLAYAYFSTRALALIPTLSALDNSDLHEQAKTIIRAYVAQARDLPVLWEHLEDSIVDGALSEHLTDPAVTENAARLSMARPFLTALLSGQARGWDTAQMVLAHKTHIPSATLLHSTSFSQLVQTSPQAAQFALTLNGPAPGQHSAASPPAHHSGLPPPYTPTTHSGPPPAATPVPYTTPTRLAIGPPPTTPTPPIIKTRPLAALCIPPSRSIVTTSSPFTTSSPNACDFCQRVGHAQYECPKRFFETLGRQLPGFLPTGEYDFPAWLNGDLLPATRLAMATYLGEFGIPPHRRFNVTLDNIATGIAPPPPKP